MRRRLRYEPVPWDGIARYDDGVPIDVVKRVVLDREMEVFDHLPQRERDRLNEDGGIAMEVAEQLLYQNQGRR